MSRTVVFTEQEFQFVRNILRRTVSPREGYLPEELSVYSVFEITLPPVVEPPIEVITLPVVDYAEVVRNEDDIETSSD